MIKGIEYNRGKYWNPPQPKTGGNGSFDALLQKEKTKQTMNAKEYLTTLSPTEPEKLQTENGVKNAFTGQELNTSISMRYELSQKYDIRNATSDEFCDLAYQLYDTKQVSPMDYVMMIFDPSKSPQSINAELFLTQANPDGKRDWIAEFEARAELNLKIGNDLGFNSYQRILKVLRQLVD